MFSEKQTLMNAYMEKRGKQLICRELVFYVFYYICFLAVLCVCVFVCLCVVCLCVIYEDVFIYTAKRVLVTSHIDDLLEGNE